MTAPVMPISLPFGMRDCKIYPYLDAQGTILAGEGFDLPHIQTFSFADAEEYVDLRGDDELAATHGNGSQVNWSLEAGGIALQLWAIFTGGQIIETGVAPNRVITLRKLSDDVRPYFKVVGQIMSDSGGDITACVFRAKCNGDIGGQFADGAFFITSADGIGLPIPGTRLLYELKQHEQKVFLSTTAEENPIMPPRNMGLSDLDDTEFTLEWEPVSGVTKYVVEHAVGPTFASWTKVTPDPTDPTATISGLTAATAYKVHIASVIGTEQGLFSPEFDVTTLPTTP